MYAAVECCAAIEQYVGLICLAKQLAIEEYVGLICRFAGCHHQQGALPWHSLHGAPYLQAHFLASAPRARGGERRQLLVGVVPLLRRALSAPPGGPLTLTAAKRKRR